MACPRCGDPAAWTKCWICGWTPDDDPPPASARKPVPVVDSRTEKEIQTGIRGALELLGYHVSDLSQDRPTRQTAGIPDLWVMGHGRCTWMEVKRPKGRTSDAQRAWHEVARKNGVPCIVVRSESDAIAWHEERRVVA